MYHKNEDENGRLTGFGYPPPDLPDIQGAQQNIPEPVSYDPTAYVPAEQVEAPAPENVPEVSQTFQTYAPPEAQYNWYAPEGSQPDLKPPVDEPYNSPEAQYNWAAPGESQPEVEPSVGEPYSPPEAQYNWTAPEANHPEVDPSVGEPYSPPDAQYNWYPPDGNQPDAEPAVDDQHNQPETQYNRHTHDGNQTDLEPVEEIPSVTPVWSSPWRNDTPAEEWHVPTYSKPHESTSNMYTPGICVDPSYSRKHVADTVPEQKPQKPRGRFGRFVRAVCLILFCSVLSGAAAYGVMEYRISRGDFTVINQVVLGGRTPGNQQGGSLTAPIATSSEGMSAQDIYDMACEQVVGIQTEAPDMGGMFGGQASSAVTGSGFIISSDGYILTNYHVVETAYLNDLPLSVFLHDGTAYEAKIIGAEESNDVALIKVEATGLNPAVIADSDDVRVGQTVYAVGNPFGDLVYTMTDGIVSALDRVVSVDRKSINTFQFSAAVNSGNSGGPIYDGNGEVIGIVTAKLMRGSVEGIGFAIPINDAIEIALELIEHGYISGRPLMGITAQTTVDPANAEFYGLVEGVQVRSVSQGSAAEKAGLVVGDIITAIDDTKIDSMESLRFAMRRFRAGDTTTLTIWRDGTENVLTITFDEDLSAGHPQRRQIEESDPPEQMVPFP